MFALHQLSSAVVSPNMDSDINANLSQSTPKVLRQCVDLLLSAKHDKYPIPLEINISEKYSEHPDIQYFKRIKSKNHYHYHKFKKTPVKPQKIDNNLLVSDFEPYSRDGLLSRISTFSTINWKLPFDNHELNELKCAQNGWKCISISINNNSKNHLVCVSCKKLFSLRFNDFDDATTFEFDIKDYEEVNLHLANEYLKQLEVTAHEANCPWRNFETPLDGIYYLKPFLHSTNEILIENYLHSLKSLVDNSSFITSKIELFNNLIIESNLKYDITKFVKISNHWLLNKYYNQDKENQISKLDAIPPWIYLISLLGWELKVQSFANQLVLFLVCSQCNKKVFLDSTQHFQINNNSKVPSSTGLNLSTSRILTPVKYPPASSFPQIDEFSANLDEETDDSIDLHNEHKSWCFMKSKSRNVEILANYLYQVIVSSESQIGVGGEFIEDLDMHIDDPSQKRKKSFDINEGLERLNKLRKLYLVDE